MDSVVHFEMPYNDRDRMTKFYETAFGWKTEKLGEDMGNYVLARTTPSDANGGPKEPGRINGGFFPKKSDYPAQAPSVVIAVEDLDESMKKIERAGGKVLGEPMAIPGVGRYVTFTDTEGNRVSLLRSERQDAKSH